MKVRSCGCVHYEYGPPVLCEKHERKLHDGEERGLRKLVQEQTARLGHKLNKFTEYESLRGKWTAFCEHCSRIVIVYDDLPERGDQVNGRPITEECNG